MLDQDGQGDAILNQPRYEEPPQAQESSKTQQPAEPQHVPKRKEVVKGTTSIKIRECYERLRLMKTSDIELQLHETLRNLDAKWLSRLLVCVVGDHKGTMVDGDHCYLLSGKDSKGSALLLKDLVSQVLNTTSMVLTKAVRWHASNK